MEFIKKYSNFNPVVESLVTEANKGKVHRAAKKGSYPAVIVVVQDGKVIHQEPVSTPDVAPATFNVMQEKYPKALLHLEDNTGKRLFSESVNEGLKHNDMYTMLDIAAGYSSTQDQAANQMWSDEQDLYDYLKSDHIPKKYHKKFYNDIKRRFKDVNE